METKYLVIVGWHGVISVPVEIVGETPKRYRVKMQANCQLPSRKLVKVGDTALVPKRAVYDRPVEI